MKTRESDIRFLSILLALLPILGPYAVYTDGIGLVDALILGIVLFIIVCRNISFERSLLVLLLILGAIGEIGYFAAIGNEQNGALFLKVLVVFFLYSAAYGSVWNNIDTELFSEASVKIGLVCAVLAILQFIAISFGHTSFYTGRLPLPLNQYSAFASLIDVTGAVRVHSFFEEPSYLALYELPVIAYCLKKSRYIELTILGIGCILSGTLLGIAGLIIVFFSCIIFGGASYKVRRTAIIVLVLVTIVFIYLNATNDAVHSLFNYYFGRYSKIGSDFDRETSSASQRLLGNIGLFANYNPINKLFGVGVNQYSIYFGLTNDYSNDFVCTLLNYGVLGLTTLVSWLLFLFRSCGKSGITHCLIFLLVLATDHTWFNEYFFFLLTWCFICSERKRNYVFMK